MSLKINVRHLEEKDLQIQGELPAAELELDENDELVRARLPLHYNLTVHQAGQDVLVRGQLEMALDCECARCLKPFGFRLKIPDWLLHLPAEGPEQAVLKDDVVDLTSYLREAILLEFPQHPLCDSDCAGLPLRADASSRKTEGSGPTPEASAWAELNKLKF
jgi:DUF177 domain-containing protein